MTMTDRSAVADEAPPASADGSAAGPGPTVETVPWAHPEATALRDAQQAELRARYGADDIGADMTGEDVVAMLVLRVDGRPVGCGALRAAAELGAGVGELKRMYVLPEHRGRGHARRLLAELERRARALGWTRLVLETGVLQPEAMGLYVRTGYLPIDLFGPYVGVVESRCFGKDLTAVPRAVSARAGRGALTLERVGWDHPDAAALRRRMWDDMILPRYPEAATAVEEAGGFEADDARQGVGTLSTVLARLDGRPVGCVTLRAARDGYPDGSGELKKVFVDPSARGAGVARRLLAAVEDDARALGLTNVVLQAGSRQPEAVTLYVSAGYDFVVPFGPYGNDTLSLCFGKVLGSPTLPA